MQWSILRELGFHFFTAFLILIIAFLTNPETFSKTFYILFTFSIFSIISESLISSSIIQSKANTQSLISSMLLVSIIIGLSLGMLFYFVADYFKFFLIFKNFYLLEIITISTIFMIIVSSVPYGLNRKNKKFKIIAFIDIISSLIAFLLSLYLITKSYHIEALIIFLFVRTLLIFVLLFWLTKLEINIKKIISLFEISYLDFGYKLSIFSFLKLLVRDIDKIIIGSVLGPVSLGLYTFVENIIIRPGALIMNGISRFNFSIFCNETIESRKIDEAYSNNLNIISFLTLSFISILAIASPFVIFKFLDSSWEQSTNLLLPLFGLILMKSLYSPIGDYWKSQANFKVMYYWSVSVLFFTSIISFFGSKTGSIMLLAYLMLCLNFVILLISLIFLKKYFIKKYFFKIKRNYAKSTLIYLITCFLFFLNQSAFNFDFKSTLFISILNICFILFLMRSALQSTKINIFNIFAK